MNNIRLIIDQNSIDVTPSQLQMLRAFDMVYFQSKTPPYYFAAYANETVDSINAFLTAIGDPLPFVVTLTPVG